MHNLGMSYHKRDTCLTITLCASSREEDAWYESTFGGGRDRVLKKFLSLFI